VAPWHIINSFHVIPCFVCGCHAVVQVTAALPNRADVLLLMGAICYQLKDYAQVQNPRPYNSTAVCSRTTAWHGLAVFAKQMDCSHCLVLRVATSCGGVASGWRRL